MQEHSDRRERDLSKYGAMSAEELNEILRLDYDSPDDAEPDTELLLYVMEVLAERRKKDDPNERTAQEAWRSFQENYLPGNDSADGRKRKAKGAVAPWLRRIIAAAAVLVLAVGIPVTARALDWDSLWNIVASWAKETFSFVSGEHGQLEEPDKNSTEEFTSLQDALIKSNRDPSIVPTWLPNGYVLDEIAKTVTPIKEIYSAIYVNGDKSLSIRIQNHLREDFQKIEINDALIETYIYNNLEYLIFSNNAQIRVLWIDGAFECMISGNLTVEEAILMINSITKGY